MIGIDLLHWSCLWIHSLGSDDQLGCVFQDASCRASSDSVKRALCLKHEGVKSATISTSRYFDWLRKKGAMPVTANSGLWG